MKPVNEGFQRLVVPVAVVVLLDSPCFDARCRMVASAVLGSRADRVRTRGRPLQEEVVVT